MSRSTNGWAVIVSCMAFGLSGCGEEPPLRPMESLPTLTYPVRSDWLVLETPKVAPTKPYAKSYAPLLGLTPDATNADADQLALLNEAKLRRLVYTKNMSNSDKTDLFHALTERFGTPSAPKVAPLEPEVQQLATDLRLDSTALAAGARLYRNYCQHCHGMTGAGDGPGGKWLVPPPRDYRQGIFKFTTTDALAGANSFKPRRADLVKTIRVGLPGSGMPSFASLSESDLDLLAGYVTHLSIRGESEYLTLKTLLNPDDFLDDPSGPDAKKYRNAIDMAVTTNLNKILHEWHKAEQSPIEVEPDTCTTYEKRLESAANGYKIYMDAQLGGCGACHVNYGRNAVPTYDVWSTVVRPRDLTQGVFRVTREPASLYKRIYAGVKASGMPEFHTTLRTPSEEKVKGRNRIWDVVHFVEALSNPQMKADLAEKYQIEIDQ